MKVSVPHREPDYILNRDPLIFHYWFDEMVRLECGRYPNERVCELEINEHGELTSVLSGHLIREVQDAYRDWQIERILLR